ncbi:lipase family alpha/beta hydrolase [Streptomyces laurentii]|uniref:lipase family alpha/beta hydrolase n=1 Tax=Streptomyces laurentii TaxID=39478 RepID=UPI0036BFBAAB
MEHDLVVFVPGFLGSRLTRDGRDVWSECGDALLRSRPTAAALAPLALPPGLGDEVPEDRFRLVADELLTSPDSMPGLLSCAGYPDLRAALGDPVDGQYVPFPYDWRLSHRLVAEELGRRITRELTRWTGQVDRHHPDRPDEPRVVLVCHSTGGLVGRYYLECLGGRDTARTLVTLGSPNEGMAQALRLLTGHGAGDGSAAGNAARGLNDVLRAFALGLPSVAQLLPVYDAVRVTGKTRPRTIADDRYPVPGLPTALVDDALSFHHAIRSAREAHRRTDPDGRPPYRVYGVGSTAHPTVRTVALTADGQDVDLSSPAYDLGPGDGTVPRESALAGWGPEDLGDMLWTDHRHADLASSAALGDKVSAIRKGLPVNAMLAGDSQITLHAPAEAVAGKPFEVAVLGTDLRDRNVRAVMRRFPRGAEQPVLLVRDAPGLLRARVEGGPGRWLVEAFAEDPRHTDKAMITLYTE